VKGGVSFTVLKCAEIRGGRKKGKAMPASIGCLEQNREEEKKKKQSSATDRKRGRIRVSLISDSCAGERKRKGANSLSGQKEKGKKRGGAAQHRGGFHSPRKKGVDVVDLINWARGEKAARPGASLHEGGGKERMVKRRYSYLSRCRW